jgi:hypothetical protein
VRIFAAAVAALSFLWAASGAARPRGPQNTEARAACGKALAAGDLAQLRIAWTWWPTRETSQTAEVKGGKLSRYGGMLRNARKERPLTDDEKKQLLAALRTAHADKLVWIDRDVKNEQDRVLNVDVVKPDGELDPVGAFVRTGTLWHAGATAPLADLLEKWLAPGQ